MNRYWMPVSTPPMESGPGTSSKQTDLTPPSQFGLGSRTCIGRHISMLEMCKLIPLLVRDFSFTLDNSLKMEDWHTQNYWFVKPVDFKVRVEMRASRGVEK